MNTLDRYFFQRGNNKPPTQKDYSTNLYTNTNYYHLVLYRTNLHMKLMVIRGIFLPSPVNNSLADAEINKLEHETKLFSGGQLG